MLAKQPLQSNDCVFFYENRLQRPNLGHAQIAKTKTFAKKNNKSLLTQNRDDFISHISMRNAPILTSTQRSTPIKRFAEIKNFANWIFLPTDAECEIRSRIVVKIRTRSQHRPAQNLTSAKATRGTVSCGVPTWTKSASSCRSEPVSPRGVCFCANFSAGSRVAALII